MTYYDILAPIVVVLALAAAFLWAFCADCRVVSRHRSSLGETLPSSSPTRPSSTVEAPKHHRAA